MNADRPTLGVAIVTYNSVRQIGPCLRALAEACADFRTHVRIVDNASTDGTPDEVERCASKLARPGLDLRLWRSETNLGFTRAMNVALDGLDAEAYLWLNPDVYLHPDSLRILWDALFRDESCGAVAPQLRNPDGSIQPSCRRFPRHRDVYAEIVDSLGLASVLPLTSTWKMPDFDHASEAVVDQPQGACLLVRGEVAKKLGPLDERFWMFFSDVDYCRRIYQAGYSIRFVPEARAVHEKGASVYQDRGTMIRISHGDFLRYFEKWAPQARVANFCLRFTLWTLLPVRLIFEAVHQRVRRFRGRTQTDPAVVAATDAASNSKRATTSSHDRPTEGGTSLIRG